MVRLNWDQYPKRYESGIERGVLYFDNYEHAVWNGLVRVQEFNEQSSGSLNYFDGLAYSMRQEIEDYAAVVEAFTYPYILDDHILALCDANSLVATQGEMKPFGFTYRTNTSHGYKLHLVYNITATVDDITRDTISDDMNLVPFSFNFYTTPVDIPGLRPSAHLLIDSSQADEGHLHELENILYGSDTTSPRFPTVTEVIAIFTG